MRLIKLLLISLITLQSLNLKAQYDADAQKNFTATGITNDTIKFAVNRLVIGLKDSSLWTKMKAVYHLAGRDATKNSYNLKDTSTYKLTYSGTLYHSATGVKSNAVTGQMNTHCAPNVAGQNSVALSFYSRDNIQYGGTDMFSVYNNYNWLYIRNMGDNALIGTNSAGFTALENTNSQGLFTSSRTSSILTTLYRNGVSIGTSTISSATPDVTDILIFGNDGVSTITRECAFASISDGLSATEARALSNVVDSFLYNLAHGGLIGGSGNGGGGDTTHSDSNWVRSGNNIYNINSGNVGIGTGSTHMGDANYKLFVAKGIRTEKLKVDVPFGSWSDYVFDKKYKLLSTKEIEQFILRNNHLPGIPSAKDLEKNGLDLGNGQALLLKKIEELTLIIIQQHKTQEKFKKLIGSQNKRINALEKSNNHK